MENDYAVCLQEFTQTPIYSYFWSTLHQISCNRSFFEFWTSSWAKPDMSYLWQETHASVVFADSRDLAWNHLISIQTWPCETWSNSFLYHPTIFLLFLTVSGPPQRSRHGRSNMAGFKRCLGSCTYQIGIQKLCTTIRCAGSRVQSKVIRGLGTKKASHEPVLSLATTPSYWTSRTKCLEEFGGWSEIEDHPSIHSAFGETNSESFKFKCTRGHWHLVYECFASSRQQCAWCRNISHRKLFKPTLPFSRGRSNSSFRTSSTLFCHRRGGKWAWQNNIVIVGPFASLYLSLLLHIVTTFVGFPSSWFFPLLSFQQVHGSVKDLERTGQKKVPSVKKCESMALESRGQSSRVNMVSRKIQRFPEKMDYKWLRCKLFSPRSTADGQNLFPSMQPRIGTKGISWWASTVIGVPKASACWSSCRSFANTTVAWFWTYSKRVKLFLENLSAFITHYQSLCLSQVSCKCRFTKQPT